jgi:Carboxypeptidase regulatory-like domain
VNGGAMPTGELKVYSAHRVTGFDSQDIQGTSFSADIETTQTMPVVVLGETPNVGDMLICSAAGGRWVCENRGESGSTPPPCTVNICVFNCNTNSFISGASVKVTGHGTSVSGTTGSNGCVSLSVPEAGTYQVQGSAPGLQSFDQSVSLACGLGAEIWLQESVSSCFEFNSAGCDGGTNTAPGSTITIAGQTQALPATICITVPGTPPPPSTTFPWTISAPNFQDKTGEVTLTGNCFAQGGPVVVGLTPAVGFTCFCGGGNCAIPATTLSLTDSVYGPATLSFSDVGGQQSWTGTLTGANYPGGLGGECPAQDNVTITYNLICNINNDNAITLHVSYTSFAGSPCPETDEAGAVLGGCLDLIATTASFCPVNLTFELGPIPGGGGLSTCTIYQSGATITVSQ